MVVVTITEFRDSFTQSLTLRNARTNNSCSFRVRKTFDTSVAFRLANASETLVGSSRQFFPHRNPLQIIEAKRLWQTRSSTSESSARNSCLLCIHLIQCGDLIVNPAYVARQDELDFYSPRGPIIRWGDS
jgi:hypothetical protein